MKKSKLKIRIQKLATEKGYPSMKLSYQDYMYVLKKAHSDTFQ